MWLVVSDCEESSVSLGVGSSVKSVECGCILYRGSKFSETVRQMTVQSRTPSVTGLRATHCSSYIVHCVGVTVTSFVIAILCSCYQLSAE
jgi:hypothetical protein